MGCGGSKIAVDAPAPHFLCSHAFKIASSPTDAVQFLQDPYSWLTIMPDHDGCEIVPIKGGSSFRVISKTGACACRRACVHACVRACVRACVQKRNGVRNPATPHHCIVHNAPTRVTHTAERSPPPPPPPPPPHHAYAPRTGDRAMDLDHPHGSVVKFRRHSHNVLSAGSGGTP